MNMLDTLLPSPRLRELHRVGLSAEPAQVYERIRHGDLTGSALVQALFLVRELPRRVTGEARAPSLRISDMRSTPERPGFALLLDDPPREVVVGAIGQVFRATIPFVHVADAQAFRDYREPGQVKVAWALRVLPRGERDSTLECEVRVDATDDATFGKFRRYFRLIGPGSRLIRRSLLHGLEREFGRPEARESSRPMPGDERLPDAVASVTQGITIAAPPERIFPWLLQMGCGRAGFYSIDRLDNGGVPSARELVPEWLQLGVGDVIPATPKGPDGFEVLAVESPRLLLLGGLFDRGTGKQLPFTHTRPARYWHVTWAFALEPLDPNTTRLHVRARAAFPAGERWHGLWIRPVHHLMQSVQLHNLAVRAEGRALRNPSASPKRKAPCAWRFVPAGAGRARHPRAP